MRFKDTGMLRSDLELVMFMRERLSEGCDIEEYNSVRDEALQRFDTAAVARWDMSGAIKGLHVDNSFGRYKHMQTTRKLRDNEKRKIHNVKG